MEVLYQLSYEGASGSLARRADPDGLEADQMLAVAIGVLRLTAGGWLLNRALGMLGPAWAAPR